MPKASKFSPDEGLTIYDLKDNDAVHWADNAILGTKSIYVDWSKAETASTTYGGMTYTNYGDGTFKLNGQKDTSSGTTSIKLFDPINIPNGRYIISDDIQNRPNGFTHVRINGVDADSTIHWNVGDPVQNGGLFVVDGTYDHYSIQLEFKNDVQLNDIVFKPMLRLASDADSTYASYAKTNKELTDIISSQGLGLLKVKMQVFQANSHILITAPLYTPFFVFGQRAVSFMFANWGTGVDFAKICDSKSDWSNMPTVTVESSGVTRITNNLNASLALVFISYADFTIS